MNHNFTPCHSSSFSKNIAMYNRISAMKPLVCFMLLAVALLSFLPSAQAQQAQRQAVAAPKNEAYKEALKKSANTVFFTENKGQWEPSILMEGETNIGSIVMKKDQLYFLSREVESEEHEAEEHEEEGDEEHETFEAHGWGIFFDGMNQNYRISKDNEIGTKYNYYIGNDPSHWASDVTAYGDVTMHNVYNGIDLRLYSQEAHTLEFDWIVNPGADYSNIKMRFKGPEGIRVDENGHLAVKLEFDEVKFDIPEAYQVIDGKKVLVNVSFKVKGDEATFAVEGKVDSRYPLIIDPSLKWGAFFDNNNNAFDEYLYAVDYDNQANVYCGGKINVQLSTSYVPLALYGYDNDYESNVDAILYKIKFDGTAILNVTYLGGTGNDGIYGMSLSPDKSRVFVCGVTSNGTFPTAGTPFDGTFNSGDGFVAAFPTSNFGSLTYSSFLGGDGGSDQMVTVRALSNTSYVVGGTVNNAVPASYISNAYDGTYSGSTEMWVGKFSTLNTLAFGTYIGGSDVEQLNDLGIFADGSIAFSGYTASSTATFPGLVNTGAAAGAGRDGVVGVIPSAGGTFSMLSRIGGAANDEFYGLTIGAFDTLFVTGFTSSTDLPLGPGASAATRFDVVANGNQDGFIGKIPKGGGTNSWLATYFGGSSNDRGNTLRSYTQYAIMAFGETGSSNFPVQNLDNGTFYDGTFNGDSWDIFWMVLGTDLRTQYFATYVGGNRNDYLGATGDPRGSNHFFVEGDSVITLGTTVHSRSFQPAVVGPATGPLAVFDADPVATPNETSDDMHFIFKWRLGGNLLNFDYGDAPLSYGTPNAIIFNSLKLGTVIDNEDFHPTTPGTRANADDNTANDDEDGISGTQIMIEDSAVSFSRTVSVTNTTGATAYLIGWIDFNRNGTFESSEQAKANVANGATTATLTWTVPTLFAAGAIDTSYLRLRLTADAAFNVTNPSPTANSQNGEIEDYLVIRFHCVDLTPALVTTANPTSCTVANGSITITNANLLVNAQYGIYYRLNGGAPVGPFYLTTANNGSVTIPNLGPGTYSAIQVFHPTNPACGDTLNSPIVLTNPTTPPPTNLTASATCVGGTLTLSATGTALVWTGPASFSATGSPVTRTNATTAMNGTYSVTQTVNNCTSAPATINVTINTNPTVAAGTSTPAVCAGQTINLTSTPTPAGTYTYSWSGPSSFTSSAQNPSRANATTAFAGVYTVTITSTAGCTATGSTSSITVNANPVATAGTSTPVVCSGGTINLTSSATPSGPTYTYNWSGPASFTSSAQNPSRGSVTTAMSGVYTVTITNSSTGCSATASTSNITVNQSPTVIATVGSPAYCTGQTISLSASPSSGTSPYTYSWSGPSSFTSTAQNPTRANATTAFSGAYTVTITDANNCTGVGTSPAVVVNQAPTLTAAVGSPTYCSGATLTLTSTPTPAGTYTYTWSGPNAFSSSAQNPTIPNVTTAASGTYTVTVVAGTNCSASATTGVTTVNQTPTVTATSSSPTYCAGTTIQLNTSVTPVGPTYTYNWSGPASFTSTAANPTRANSTVAMSGVYNVTVTNSATGCSATDATPNLTVNPGLTVTAGSNSAVCTGGTLNLTSSATGGTGSLTYNWSGPSFSSNLQNPSRSAATAAFAGTYNVTVSDVNGCSGTATTNVVVNPTATVTVSSNSPVCSGATLNLNASLSGGTSPFTYSWSGPASFTSAAATPSRANALTSYSGAYNVTVTDANGCSGTGTTSVTINQSPVVTAGSSSPTYCSGATISLTSSVAGGATPYTYLWSGPASFTANTQNPTRPSALTTHSGTYTVTVTDANGCTGVATTPTITVNPSPTVSVASNSPVCANGTISLTSTPASGTTPYTYLWSGPVSFGSTAQNPTRTNALVSYSGVYAVTVTDANSCTATANTTVTVVARPSTPVASSNSPVCTGNTLNLLGSGGTTGATWNWVGPNSFTSSLQNPSITNVTTAAAGVYRLYQTLGGCTSDTATTTVVINVTPNAPTINATPATTLCSGDTLTLTATGQVGATFTWSGPNGYTFVGNPAIRTGVTTAMSGSYTAIQTVSGCPSVPSTPLNITINQRPTAPTPTSNTPRCYGDTLKFTAATVSGATYSWSGPLGYTASVQNPVRANAVPAMSGTYSLTITVNGCTSTNSATVAATVTSCPPVAVNDNYTTPEETTLNVPAPGVLTNDSDPANPQQPLTVTGTPVTNPANGTLTVLNGNGSFTYTPATNFTGVDSFSYRVCDNEVPVACDTATVYITVSPVNDPPQIPDTSVTTCEECPITVCVPITDPETATQLHNVTGVLCGPNSGTITGPTVNNGSNPHTICLTYTPTTNFVGNDSICLIVCDNGTPSRCDTNKIRITVTPVNDPPVAVNDNYTTNEDVPVVTNSVTGVRNNDNDNADGNPVTSLTVTTTPINNVDNGTLILNTDGSFTYTPNSNFTGTDSFQYRVCDNGTPLPSLCDTATAYITISPVNDPPRIPDTTRTTCEDCPITVCLPITDPETATQSHFVSSVYCGPNQGTVTSTTVTNTGNPHTVCVDYTPNSNYNGVDSVCIVICDNGVPSLCDTSKITIIVTPVNDPPIAVNDIYVSCDDTTILKNVLVNDSDIDGPNLQLVGTIGGFGPTTGTLNFIQPLGNFSYTPTLNFNGIDSFYYIICDNGTPNLCDTAKVTLDFTCTNVPPIAVNDNFTTPEDSPVNGNVSTNDSDPDGGTLTYTTTPINNVDSGTLVLTSTGTFTYTPNTNFNGVDSFIYRVCDNGVPSLCDTATAYITVTPVNDPPRIPDTTRTTCEDCPPVTVCLPISDVDAGDQHFASIPCAASHGTVTSVVVNNLSNPHTVCMVYTPAVNYNGTDSFCVVVCDNGTPSKCDTATVTIIVTPVNDPPVAVNDNYTTGEDVTLTVPTGTGVRANDNDNADGNPVTSLTVTTTPINNVDNGTLTVNADGSFTYVPNANFTGVDSFVYRVCDNGTPLPSLCDTATAYITVTPSNDPPQIPDTTVTTCEDCPPTTVCLPITDVDGGDQHYALTPCAPLHGTVTSVVVNNLSNPHTVCMVYTPTTNYNGVDSFCVVVCDNGTPFKCDTSTVTIIVTPVNDPPVAVNDNYTTPEDVTLVAGSVTGVRNNDNDNADGNPVTSLTVTPLPINNVDSGVLVLNTDGSFTYTPNTNFTGVDSFQYRVCDNGTPLPSLCDTATAYINVVPANDPPQVPDTTVTMCEDCPPTTVCLPITDPETTTQIHVASVCGLPLHGTISTLNVNNASNPHTVCVTYTPTVNYNGTDSFCVIVCDNGAPGKCDTSTITIIVTPVNDPPVAINDNYTTTEDVTLNVPTGTGVRANDNDNADGNPVTSLTVTTTPINNVDNGTLTVNADGSFTYVPNPNFTGVDSFIYRVCDNGTPLPSLCDTATAYITVTPVNDPPEVPDTTVTTCEDCSPTTVCVPIFDNDTADLHFATLLCPATIGNITNVTVNQTANSLCFDYRSLLNLNGRDTVCFVVCDNGIPSKCDTTTITIIVTPVNDPPVAINDNYTTPEDVTLVRNSVQGVRNNDNDNADGNPVTSLTVTPTPLTGTTNGTLTLFPDGSFTYVPNANFFGTDSFVYRVCDSGTPLPSLCDTATAYITITPVNDPPEVPDTTITTCEDCDTTYVCVPITDADTIDLHFANLLCPATIGTVTSITIDQTLNVLCLGYKGLLNLHGTDSLCVVVCDNGTPTLCDTSYITIIVDPVNDPPYADTIYVTTYENQPVGVNVASATGDVEGDPLSYSYGSPNPAGGTYGITGNGAITVTPNTGFTGVFTIPYGVCDLSPYPVNVLCDSAAIVVTVLPLTDTLINHAPVANNDYVTVPFNSTGHVINQLANDYDPDGDALAVTVTANPLHGTTTVNGNGTLNYTPVTGYFGYDTIGYTICDPTAVNLPRPLCDQAIVVIYIGKDTTILVNDPPVAVDDYEFVCADANAIVNVLRNDYDINGDALTSVTVINNFDNGTVTNAGLGLFVYDANLGFTGDDTLTYVVCDNGTPSLCDTANAIVRVNANPIITPSSSSLNLCSNDSVNITFVSSVPGTTFSWTANNGTSGTGDIHTVLTNTTSNAVTVTYSVTGVSPSGCGSTTITIPVTVRPRPIATALQNGNLFCSGEQVVVNLTSSVPGTTFNWSSSQGGTGTGNLITQTLTNTGTSNVTVTYTIVPSVGGCTGDTLLATAVVKPRPVITPNPATQTSCSGQPITINLTSSIPGATVTWTGSNGNSGNSLTINDSPVNNSANPITVTYTINSSFNGCVGNTVFSTVTVRPAIVADAGGDQSVSACSASCVTLGGSPAASGAPGPFTYTWRPAFGLSDTTVANPTACNLTVATTYELIVTDTFGCFDNDFVTVNVTPSSLTAEAGVGGALCLGTGDSVQLGGFPTAVGGTPPYTYTWSPLTGLNLTNPANPEAFPTASTTYYLTVTDALGCQSVDSTIVNVYPTLVANAGTDTTVCAGSTFTLGADTVATGGSGAGYTYVWSPTVGISNINAANPTGVAFTTTTYVVTVTDANGCTATDSKLVNINPTPTAQAGPDKVLTRCAGDSVIIGDNPAALGGTPGYTYSWSPATGLSSTTVANPVVRVGATTTYTLTVTDVNGCTSVDAVTVNVVNSTFSVNAGTDKEICFGNCVQLGGIPTAVGGFPPYFYSWNNGGTLDDSTDANPVACPASTTTFILRATDSRGCVSSDAVTVTVNPNPIVNAGPDTTVCIGSSIQIGGAPTATGGTPGYTYSWNPNLGLSQPNVANPTAAPAVITTYQLIVTDTKGCIGLDEVTVTPRSTPVVDAGADKTLVSCTADTVVIGGLPAVTGGGTGPFTYIWTPTTGLSDSTIANPYVTGITATTSYQLTVIDSFGCSGNDFVVVNVVNSTLQVEAGNGGVVCAASGSPVQLGGTPTAVGGTTPYTYAWSNGAFLNDSTAPNPIATVTTTTKFFITVTDAKGCQSVDSVTVTQNATPVANAGTDTTVCAGFCVTLNASSTGGTGTYQYAWSPTVGLNNNNTANPLACPQVTTTYVVTVTDSLGCNSTDAVTITIRPQPVADAGADKTMTSCVADSIQIGGSPAASGGVGPYTYSWNPTTGLSDSLAANPFVKGITGTTLYAITVTDASRCSAVDVVQVTIVPTTLAVSAGPDLFVCQNTLGSVTVGGSPTAAGGTGPYTYTWSGTNLLATNTANPTVSPISATSTYAVTVTDAKGCTATDNATINVSVPPVINAGIDTAICASTSVTLGGIPTATPAGVYTYAWSPGVGLSSTTASNPTATPSVTTTYVLTVTYGNNCSITDAVTVTVRPNPIANAGPDRTLIACSGDSVQIGGTPAATSGTPPYTYLWSPSAGLTDTSIARPYVKNLGASALYTLQVTDTFGCSSSDQVAVNVTGGTLVAEAGNNVAFCFGNATNVTLGGTPTANGGTPVYTYLWSPAAGLSATNVANPVANTSVSRTYRVVVTDASGCIAQDSVRITVNPRIVVNAGTTDTVCAGSCITLGGAPTAIGGSGSTYTYSWGPAIYFQGSNTVANPVVCPINSVTYSVIVTDSIGCTNTANVTINVNQNPIANAGTDKSVVSCPGACVALGGSPTATSGTAPYLYAWSPATSLNNTGLPNPTVCNLDTTGIYTVTVTDANGCTATDQVLVNSTTSTLVADAGLDKTICAGQTTCITIGGTPAVTGGVGPYTVTWSPVAGMCTSNTVNNPEVNPTDTTTYVLLVSDANGCVAVDSMTVIVNPAVTASVGADTAVCNGNAALLGGNPTASGGTAPFTYLWSPSTGLSSITASNPTAAPSITTSYCVTVTDAVGCTASTCQQVAIDPSVFADAGNDQTITACPGSFVLIGGSPTATGGTGNYSYTWAPDSVGGVRVLNGTTIPNPAVTNLSTTTTFTVTVRDNVSGCTATDQVTITVNPSTLTVDAGFSKVFCANSSSCVQIGGAPTATGGVAPYLYQWSPGAGLNSTTVANPCANPLLTTNYAVTVTDALGCSFVDSVQVYVSPFIVANAGVDSAICYGTNVVLGGPAVGGTGSYTYLWSPSQFLTSTTVANPTAVNVTSNISYTLVVTDSLGCSAEDIVAISTRALPIASAGPDATIFACSADSVILGGSPTASGTVGPYTYSWLPAIPVPANGSNPVVKNLGFSTNFTVTVTDVFGCQASDAAFITVQPNTVFVDAGTNIGALCSNVGSCVTLGGPILGGTSPYTYVWTGGTVSNDSILNPQACPLVSTTYNLVVTDANGCQASDTVRVIVNPAPNANITGLASAYCVSAGNVTMTGIPAGGSFSGPGVTGNVFQPSVVGQGFYCIRYVYTDALTGCTDDTTICVTVNPDPIVTISGYAANYCRFDAPDTLIGLPAGGTFSGPGITGNVFNPATANIGNNIITYTYSDSLGCSGLAQVTIDVRQVPTISVTANDDTACVGQSVVLSPNYSVDVTNIQWSTVGGGIFASGLNPVTVTPTGVDYCVVAIAISNTSGCTNRDTVCLHVNQPPVAVNDELATCEEITDTALVLLNDVDPEGDSNTVTVLSVNHGTTTVIGGLVIYTPTLNYNGFDTIVYAICNTQCTNACDTAIVAITVCPVNDPPVVTDIIDTIYTNQTDTACPIAVDVDNTNLTLSLLLCDSLNGTVTPIVNGCFTYTPPFNWIGTQVVCVVACDSLGACDTGTVTIVVIPGNRPPRGLDVNVAVCTNTPVGVNVAAAAGDPNGNPLTFSYGAITGPAGAAFTVTGNGAIVFEADSAGTYFIPYYVCDQSNVPPFSMCDTAVITVVVIACDSTNNPPVATDDIAVVLVNDTVTINELANDFDPDGDPLNVTILDGPSLTGATATLNPDGTVTYTSPTVGVDSITYAICDPAGLCDTAYIIIYVDSVFANHPPVAVDDYATTTYTTPVTVPVLGNDHDPDGNTITITGIPCAPANGTAVITGTTIVYTPGAAANALNPDTFCYVICDNGTPSLCDTALVVINIPNSVQAVNDTVNATPYLPVTIDVMDNDFDPESDSFYVTTIITTNTYGTVVLNPNGTVTYVPKDSCGFTDTFQYVVQDVLGAVDTATVYVTVNCCTPPVAINDAATIVPNAPFGIDVLANDTINGLFGSGSVLTAPAHGTAVFTNDSVLTYTPAANYCGLDTVVYTLRTTCGIDTGLFIVNVYCNTPPVAIIDEVVVCANTSITIDVLANDTDAEGDTLTVTAVSQPPFGLGTSVLNPDGTVTFNAPSAATIITLNYTVCDSSFPNLCSTGTIRIEVQGCDPVDIAATIPVTTCMDSSATVCVGQYVTGGSFTITSTGTANNGTVAVVTGDTCFTYTPNSGYMGNDTFTLTVCNNAGLCDSSQVVVTIVDCLIDAIPDACDVNTTVINTTTNVNVLDNDLLPFGSDTTVTVISNVENGVASVNPDNTIMVTPNADYVGNVTLTYEVCVTTGTSSYCDTASVCVNVIDTNCVIPTGFSPNGDGTNDQFEIPCNDQFPNATLRVYNRWGVEVWASNGHYNNDFKGQNMQETNLPDGTYFIIYDYKDGVTKPVQRYLVIHR